MDRQAPSKRAFSLCFWGERFGGGRMQAAEARRQTISEQEATSRQPTAGRAPNLTCGAGRGRGQPPREETRGALPSLCHVWHCGRAPSGHNWVWAVCLANRPPPGLGLILGRLTWFLVPCRSLGPPVSLASPKKILALPFAISQEGRIYFIWLEAL